MIFGLIFEYVPILKQLVLERDNEFTFSVRHILELLSPEMLISIYVVFMNLIGDNNYIINNNNSNWISD